MNPNKKDKKTKSSFSSTNLPIQNDPKKRQENKRAHNKKSIRIPTSFKNLIPSR
jgi:hypothetical protein